MACGFIITSGITPSFENGISYSGNIIPIVPFYAPIEASLSPIYGYIESLNLNLIDLNPS